MDDRQPTEQPKKRHRKWPWITLFIVIIIPLCLIGYSGLWHIPVISTVFGASKPKDLGVHPTAADWTSVSTKVPIRVEGDAAKYSVFGNKAYSGSVPTTNTLTSAEVTAWIQHYTAADPLIKNVQVKFIPGGMEISTMFKKYIDAPVYVKVMVARTGPQAVSLNVTKGSIGKFPVPEQYLKQFSEYAQDIVNKHLPQIPGFTINALSYADGSRSFDGTYPQSITTASGNWWGE